MSAAVHADAIPLELRERPQWVIWRTEHRDGKSTKVPYRATAPDVRASSTDPATWASFDDAYAAYEAGHADGVGFVFTDADPYFGLDLDDELSEADCGAIVLALGTYTETSPSGNGMHVIGRGSLNGAGRHPVGIGVFDRGRYFTVTGDHVTGTPTTVEECQASLDEVVARFLPARAPVRAALPPQPVDIDDQELLDRAFAARNGADVRALWAGDWPSLLRYGSQSEADIALATHLAFWTGRDPGRIDRLFRASGLYREKWERDDYRDATIAKAIAATTDVYEPASTKCVPRPDALGRTYASAPTTEAEGAGASVRPPLRGRTDGTHPPTSSVVVDEVRPSPRTHPHVEPPLVVVEAAAFAAVEEASATPLLGDTAGTILAAGGSAVWYGDGGAGKTTLGLDQAFHLCAGIDWLGLPVPRPCTVLWIENEGPRGKFRAKLRAKLDAWDGPSLGGRLHVLEQPWSLFTFANDHHRAELVALIRERGIDVVFAGPVQRLGVEGGGTPAEIQAFVHLLEHVRAELERPLAYELIHHENKSGDISGAWEGATDTLAHVQARGNGRTAIVWRKVRWASELHGRTWKLDWQPGESFDLDETPETTDEDIADRLLELVHDAPGGSWNTYDKPEHLRGNDDRKRAIRDRLIADGRLVNTGTAKSMRLYLPEQVDTLPIDEGEDG